MSSSCQWFYFLFFIFIEFQSDQVEFYYLQLQHLIIKFVHNRMNKTHNLRYLFNSLSLTFRQSYIFIKLLIVDSITGNWIQCNVILVTRMHHDGDV